MGVLFMEVKYQIFHTIFFPFVRKGGFFIKKNKQHLNVLNIFKTTMQQPTQGKFSKHNIFLSSFHTFKSK